MLRSEASFDDASLKVRALATALTAAASLRFAIKSSINFATKIVHVTRDAKASPIMIACTMRLADTNIDQGDNSRSPTVTDLAMVLAEALGSSLTTPAAGVA